MYPNIIGKTQVFLKHLAKSRYTKIRDIPLKFAGTRKHYHSVPRLKFRPVKLPFAWGGDGITGWFRARTAIPGQAKNRELYIRAEMGGESCLLINGRYHAGLDVAHKEVLIAKKARPGARLDLAVESYAGHWIPGVNINQPRHILNSVISWEERAGFPVHVKDFSLVVKNISIDGLYWDMTALLETAQILEENSLRRNQILQGLAQSMTVVPYSGRDTRPDRSRGRQGITYIKAVNA
jgi:hypothetical protein